MNGGVLGMRGDAWGLWLRGLSWGKGNYEWSDRRRGVGEMGMGRDGHLGEGS